jgi:hypothetical protein
VCFKTLTEKLRLAVLAGLICGNPIGATPQKPAQAEAQQAEAQQEEQPSVDLVIKEKSLRRHVFYGETVKRVFAPQVHDWKVVDQQRLILYATRSRPYLVILRRKAMALNSSTIIGLERHGNSIDSRFDQIYVDGFPYPIERIEKLTVETARRLRGLEVEVEPEQKN